VSPYFISSFTHIFPSNFLIKNFWAPWFMLGIMNVAQCGKHIWLLDKN
jgi:hypothetical protein